KRGNYQAGRIHPQISLMGHAPVTPGVKRPDNWICRSAGLAFPFVIPSGASSMSRLPALAALLPALLVCAEPPLESIRFKDKFTLQFPAAYIVKADSDRVSPTVSFARLDSQYRIDAKVCR